MREKYRGQQSARDFYHHRKMGKPKPEDELQQHLTGWQEDHPEMRIVVDPDIGSVDLEYTESDSNAVPLMEKPIYAESGEPMQTCVPKTGVELAKLITIFEANGQDALPVVKASETLWRKEGEK